MMNNDDLASPCTNECVFDGDSSFCLGCYRTLEEVMRWGRLDPESKRAVLQRIQARRDTPPG